LTPRTAPPFPTRRSSDLYQVAQQRAGDGAGLVGMPILGRGLEACLPVGMAGEEAIDVGGVRGLESAFPGGVLSAQLGGQLGNPRSEEHSSELQSLTNLVC